MGAFGIQQMGGATSDSSDEENSPRLPIPLVRYVAVFAVPIGSLTVPLFEHGSDAELFDEFVSQLLNAPPSNCQRFSFSYGETASLFVVRRNLIGCLICYSSVQREKRLELVEAVLSSCAELSPPLPLSLSTSTPSLSWSLLHVSEGQRVPFQRQSKLEQAGEEGRQERGTMRRAEEEEGFALLGQEERNSTEEAGNKLEMERKEQKREKDHEGMEEREKGRSSSLDGTSASDDGPFLHLRSLFDEISGCAPSPVVLRMHPGAPSAFLVKNKEDDAAMMNQQRRVAAMLCTDAPRQRQQQPQTQEGGLEGHGSRDGKPATKSSDSVWTKVELNFGKVVGGSLLSSLGITRSSSDHGEKSSVLLITSPSSSVAKPGSVAEAADANAHRLSFREELAKVDADSDEDDEDDSSGFLFFGKLCNGELESPKGSCKKLVAEEEEEKEGERRGAKGEGLISTALARSAGPTLGLVVGGEPPSRGLSIPIRSQSGKSNPHSRGIPLLSSFSSLEGHYQQQQRQTENSRKTEGSRPQNSTSQAKSCVGEDEESRDRAPNVPSSFLCDSHLGSPASAAQLSCNSVLEASPPLPLSLTMRQEGKEKDKSLEEEIVEGNRYSSSSASPSITSRIIGSLAQSLHAPLSDSKLSSRRRAKVTSKSERWGGGGVPGVRRAHPESTPASSKSPLGRSIVSWDTSRSASSNTSPLNISLGSHANSKDDLPGENSSRKSVHFHRRSLSVELVDLDSSADDEHSGADAGAGGLGPAPANVGPGGLLQLLHDSDDAADEEVSTPTFGHFPESLVFSGSGSQTNSPASAVGPSEGSSGYTSSSASNRSGAKATASVASGGGTKNRLSAWVRSKSTSTANCGSSTSSSPGSDSGNETTMPGSAGTGSCNSVGGAGSSQVSSSSEQKPPVSRQLQHGWAQKKSRLGIHKLWDIMPSPGGVGKSNFGGSRGAGCDPGVGPTTVSKSSSGEAEASALLSPEMEGPAPEEILLSNQTNRHFANVRVPHTVSADHGSSLKAATAVGVGADKERLGLRSHISSAMRMVIPSFQETFSSSTSGTERSDSLEKKDDRGSSLTQPPLSDIPPRGGSYGSQAGDPVATALRHHRHHHARSASVSNDFLLGGFSSSGDGREIDADEERETNTTQVNSSPLVLLGEKDDYLAPGFIYTSKSPTGKQRQLHFHHQHHSSISSLLLSSSSSSPPSVSPNFSSSAVDSSQHRNLLLLPLSSNSSSSSDLLPTSVEKSPKGTSLSWKKKLTGTLSSYSTAVLSPRNFSFRKMRGDLDS